MNIICFETEWLYNHHEKKNRFNLNCRPVLQCLKDFYGCDFIYRNFLTKDDLKYYMDYFNTLSFKKKYPLVYISTHGWNGSIHLEGIKEKKRKNKLYDEEENRSDIKLSDLAQMSPGFFEGRIVHFSSCKTLLNTGTAMRFKDDTGALLVSGYQKSVDAMRSVILDMAYFDALQNFHVSTLVKETSRFQKRYRSLMDDLQFIFV